MGNDTPGIMIDIDKIPDSSIKICQEQKTPLP